MVEEEWIKNYLSKFNVFISKPCELLEIHYPDNKKEYHIRYHKNGETHYQVLGEI